MLGVDGKSLVLGKVAVVTGGVKGVGAATAQRLIDKGAHVIVVDLEEPLAEQLGGRRPIALRGDVTNLSDMTRVVDRVLEQFGKIDIVIANAGVAARGTTVHASSPQVLDRLFDVNVRGVLNTVHACLPSIMAGGGQVVLLSSVFAYLNGVGTIPYAMSKAAIEQLGRGLRVELAPYDVGVTTVYFAMVETDMIRQSVDADPAARALLDSLPRFLHKRITAEAAAEAIVAGIQRRDTRVVRPRRWAAVSSLRGVLGPVLDAYMSRHAGIQSIVQDLDARSGQDHLTT